MAQLLDPVHIASHIRAVTPDEVDFYREHGWVKLKGLVSAELTSELLRTGNEWHDRHGKRGDEWLPMAQNSQVELFRSLVFSEVMGRNAQLLIDRTRLSTTDVGVRYRIDHFIRKPPGAPGVPYHQDTTEHGTDRGGELQFWLALTEARPEMGTMRFLSGVHREGPLGTVLRPDAQDLLQYYPRLTEHYPLTEAMHYQPGDATVHHGFMVHGSAPNRSDRPRMSYIMSFTPADSRWWNGKVGNWGSERTALSDAANPVIYPLA